MRRYETSQTPISSNQVYDNSSNNGLAGINHVIFFFIKRI